MNFLCQTPKTVAYLVRQDKTAGWKALVQLTSHRFVVRDQSIYCNCIVTRGGVYNEILPEPEGNPEGGARGIS